MKIPKNYLIAGISTLIIAGAGIAYYLSTRDNPETLGWMSTSWLYRKSISVSNSGSTLTNEDVLIPVDTASLVTAGKLQSDCDDLRFTDSDETTTLTYWVEAGCNTSTTQVWVRIPSLTSGGKTIYMYYGNSSATNSEASWSGNFILLYNSTCPTGWTRTSTYDSKFPYGASSYGGTGGATTHTQGTPSCTTGAPNTSTQYTQSDSGGTTASPTHTHTGAMVSVDSANNLPPYLNMVFCTNSNLNITSGLITLFTSTPSGWTRFSALDSSFARGASSYGGTGGATTHTHTTTGGYTTGSSGTRTDSPGNSVGAGGHTHTTINGTTGSGTSLPPYLDMIFASKNASGYAASGLISMTTATPPLGWTRYTSLDSNFARGASTQGGTGGTTTHTHSVTITTSTGPSSAVSEGSRVSSAAKINHYHSCTTTTDSASHVPAYVNTLYYQRKSSQSVTIGSEVTANTAPNAPTSLQAEGATNPISVSDTTPEFSAIFTDPDTTNTGNYYQIQVNTNSSFTGTTMWDSTKTALSPVVANGARSQTISYNGTTLPLDGTKYYWRIKFWDNQSYSNESAWSAVANFTMNIYPSAPTSLLTEGQTNPISVPDTTPEFSAIFNDPDTSDTGTRYQIQVNTNSSFTGTIMWDSGLTSMTSTANGSRSPDISYAGTTLPLNGAKYYWRIRFANSYGTAETWSATANFTMNNIPTAPTELLAEGETSPINVTDTTPEFSAIFNDPDTSDTANYYQIQVNTNSSFTGTTMWDSTKTTLSPVVANGVRSQDISYNGTTLPLNGITYYWRIKFWDNNNNEGTWSSTANFLTSGDPDQPSSLLTNNLTNPTMLTRVPPYFSAVYSDINNNSASAYQINVNTSSDFTGTSMWDSGKTSTTITNGQRSSEYYYSGTPMANSGTTYYWRIKFWDSDDRASEWSDASQFTDIYARFLFNSLGINGIKLN